ncbi:MAG: hypothetical protein A2Y94_13865 [Caldithrix sp. RBG_13_44_9]|nr:MAG: hypothetical protein A2Y94_13865 [Caldithrix sp. RBG_13_44_9]
MSHKATLDLKDARRKLKKLRFVNKGGSKHEKWVGPKGQIVMLSYGNQDIRPTLLKLICSQAQIEFEEFLKVR